ncbi:hypothetical protein MKW98_003583 [Papaver atlanticum]|uniref:Uncharacterized protein n=1 Tax=Papaver atlanticum TaxID=357466 RepID=A0AAD4SJN2_9MAGN|nr:hypothetical protein MKW98_003583 [Papaver atlanticum]
MANVNLTLEKYPSYNTFSARNEINLGATSSRYDDGSSFTCEICVENVPLNAKCKNLCFHNYCTDCIAKYIQVKVSQDNIVVLDILSCRSILSENVFEKWCRVHCESTVLLESSKGGFAYGRSYCPYRDCSELILNECVETNSTTKLFCFHCMVPWKENHRCTDRSETIIDIDSNDVLFIENVKHNKWVRYPCKTRFCYNCGEQICICKNRLRCWQILISCIYFLAMSPLIVLCAICGLIIVGTMRLLVRFGVVPPDHDLVQGLP